jgi:hypothetical protein
MVAVVVGYTNFAEGEEKIIPSESARRLRKF